MGLNKDTVKNKVKLQISPVREFLAEFLGTFILIAFGCAASCQHVMSGGSHGGYLGMAIVWGTGVTMGVYASVGVSGGHINPAVSLAMTLLGRLTPWWKLLIYSLAQYVGAIAGAACVYGVYKDAITDFEKRNNQSYGMTTAGMFATYPKPFLSVGSGLGDQIFGTALLLICILAITDKYNACPAKGLQPIAIGASVAAIGLSVGYNCGWAINPARDLGPRILTAMAGWGKKVFTEPNGYHFFWIPLVGPYIGAVAGTIMYQVFVGLHHPEQDEYLINEDVDHNQLAMKIQTVLKEQAGEDNIAYSTITDDRLPGPGKGGHI